jgi:putative hemolysin
MKIKLFILVTLFVLTMLLFAACSSSSSTDIANPASENCVEQGGTVVIEERGDGGQYGVCLFEENRQCEEWAMLRGDCPVGGIKVTGYITDAGRFCAITGGTYEVTGSDDSGEELGTCTLADGQTCDAWGYYNGECPACSG